MLSFKNLRALSVASSNSYMTNRITITFFESVLSAMPGLLLTSGSAAGLDLPIQEKFALPGLNPAWIEEVSPGTKLDLRNDGLHFNGPAHGVGHLQREAGTDLITVSARIAQWGSVY